MEDPNPREAPLPENAEPMPPDDMIEFEERVVQREDTSPGVQTPPPEVRSPD